VDKEQRDEPAACLLNAAPSAPAHGLPESIKPTTSNLLEKEVESDLARQGNQNVNAH
jgi:hypothetical protein